VFYVCEEKRIIACLAAKSYFFTVVKTAFQQRRKPCVTT
jgi:hypothetical protein